MKLIIIYHSFILKKESKTVKKDSKTKIGRVYALALYEAAEAKKAVSRVSDDMAKLLDAVKADSEIVKYLSNPLWNVDDKKAALKAVAAKMKLSDETLNCLDLIAENGRFAELPQILEAFRHIFYEKHGIAEVEVGTVKELSAAQDEKLRANLEKMLSRKVVVKYEIKPELLGGLVIKFNSNMIDDSLKSKLNRLELVMKGGQ